MKTVGPYVAARPLDATAAPRPVTTLHALDRLTGMPALVYLLPLPGTLPPLPGSPSLLPYTESGQLEEQAYLACELPPHASPASDVTSAALGGLRALNALHEAGALHGGVGPYQLWTWDGEVRLAGAGLPWGEAEGSWRAPEGGRSPAADIYALGVTLLTLGPLPAGLEDLLSPYAAQRPSARDALARLNAGPPLPAEVRPLLVQAPLPTRHNPQEQAISAVDPLPLVLDAEDRWQDVTPQDLLAEPKSMPWAALPSDIDNALAIFEDQLQHESHSPPEPEVTLAREVSIVTPKAPEAPSETETLPEAEIVMAQAVPQASAEVADLRFGAPDLRAIPPSTPVDAPLCAPEAVSVPAEAQPESELESEPEPFTAPPVALETPPEASPSRPARQLRPVKIGWSQAGWQVKREGEALDTGPGDVALPRRGAAARSAAAKRLWLSVAAALLIALVLLLALRSVWSGGRTAAQPGCCDIQARVLGSSGQRLSVPVQLSALSVPTGSHLSAGRLLGTAPGTMQLDSPGNYVLRLSAASYLPQTVKLSVPLSEPLSIQLE